MLTRSAEAIRCFEAAATLWPKNPKLPNNIGAALKEQGQIDQALVYFQQALQLDPKYSDGYCNIGGSYATIGENQLAIDAYREALRLKPDFAEVHSNLLLAMLSPTHLSREAVFEEHLAWDRAQTAAVQKLPAVACKLPVDRKIRVAYVSPDFREHSVRYFIEPIFAGCDRNAFHVVCYATGRRRDAITSHLSKFVDEWHFVAELTHEQLANLIRSHEIDILVDLAGHTSDNRLLTFAARPAPIQVTYLGYPSTTGLGAMDFRLTDAICDPPGSDPYYVENTCSIAEGFFHLSGRSSRLVRSRFASRSEWSFYFRVVQCVHQNE